MPETFNWIPWNRAGGQKKGCREQVQRGHGCAPSLQRRRSNRKWVHFIDTWSAKHDLPKIDSIIRNEFRNSSQTLAGSRSWSFCTQENPSEQHAIRLRQSIDCDNTQNRLVTYEYNIVWLVTLLTRAYTIQKHLSIRCESCSPTKYTY